MGVSGKKSESIQTSLLVFCLFQFITTVHLFPFATSQVSFTRYIKVSPSEWETFYRNRGDNLRPILPLKVRFGIIPASHYSYQIQHDSQPKTEGHYRLPKPPKRTVNPIDTTPIIFKDENTHPDSNYKIEFPKWPESHENISAESKIIFRDLETKQQKPNADRPLEISQLHIANPSSTPMAIPAENANSAHESQLNELSTKYSDTADDNSLLHEFEKFLECNPSKQFKEVSL